MTASQHEWRLVRIDCGDLRSVTWKTADTCESRFPSIVFMQVSLGIGCANLALLLEQTVSLSVRFTICG